MISVSHLSHSFGTHWVLKDISFSLGKGEFLFLTGPSGAGKTTLLKILYGAQELQRGQGSVAGFDLAGLSKRRLPLLRREVGVVFQDFKILPDRTVFENVAIALEVRGLPRPLLERRTRAVLRAAHLEEKSYSLCRELSGGEQQRVAIARSMVVNPRLILADEPTGNLDRNLANHLMDIFSLFHTHGTTVVMATHNPELICRIPDARAMELTSGQITRANWPGAKVHGENPEVRA